MLTTTELLFLTKMASNNDDKDENKKYADDDVDALKPSFCLHNHAQNKGVVVVNKDGKQRR